MKKALTAVLAVAVGFALAPAASAQIVGSVHDLTFATGGGNYFTDSTDRVCVFCHTPHGSSTTQQPLWNRQAPTTVYTMYDDAFSNTINMTVAGSPQGVSLACLSCHDGTVGFDVLINAPTLVSGTYNYTAGGVSQGWDWTGGSGSSLSGAGAPLEFGNDLTTEHPISITYDPTLDPDFFAIADAEADGIVFYGGTGDQVECGSCHDPHDQTNIPFLRISNAASALCTACHDK